MTDDDTPHLRQRCLVAQQCLPDAPYRSNLEALHTELLDTVDRLTSEASVKNKQLAEATLHAKNGWARYENSNSLAKSTMDELADVSAQLARAETRSQELLNTLYAASNALRADQARYRWLIDYLKSDCYEYDDALVECASREAFDSLIDSGIAKEKQVA